MAEIENKDKGVGLFKYSVKTGDYEKYIEINGIRSATCAQAFEIKDNDAKYFIVEKDGEFYTDFCIYKEDNWLTLNRKLFLDSEFLDDILPYIKSEVDYFICYIPVENDRVYDTIKNRFNNIEVVDVEQGGIFFRKVKVIF